MFVVAATEGWKPQSEEHLRILELLGVAHGLVVLTKVGLVDDETRELARLELEDMVAGTFLEGAEVVEVDVLAGEGVDGLRAALDRLLESRRRRPTGAGPACGSTGCSRPRGPAPSSPARSPAGRWRSTTTW